MDAELETALRARITALEEHIAWHVATAAALPEQLAAAEHELNDALRRIRSLTAQLAALDGSV